MATARSMSRSSACMSAWTERAIVAASFKYDLSTDSSALVL
jgi:hypothetical protein